MQLRVLLCVLAVISVACGTASEVTGDVTDGSEPGVAGPSEGSGTELPGGAAGGAAGGTALRAVPLEEALTTEPEGARLITGLLIDDGSGWRLCTAVAESYPPQCAGDAVTVEGVEPVDHNLEQASGVQWQEDATVFGELRGDTITVQGPPAAA